MARGLYEQAPIAAGRAAGPGQWFLSSSDWFTNALREE